VRSTRRAHRARGVCHLLRRAFSVARPCRSGADGRSCVTNSRPTRSRRIHRSRAPTHPLQFYAGGGEVTTSTPGGDVFSPAAESGGGAALLARRAWVPHGKAKRGCEFVRRSRLRTTPDSSPAPVWNTWQGRTGRAPVRVISHNPTAHERASRGTLARTLSGRRSARGRGHDSRPVHLPAAGPPGGSRVTPWRGTAGCREGWREALPGASAGSITARRARAVDGPHASVCGLHQRP
jgi:hypothetical protein